MKGSDLLDIVDGPGVALLLDAGDALSGGLEVHDALAAVARLVVPSLADGVVVRLADGTPPVARGLRDHSS